MSIPVGVPASSSTLTSTRRRASVRAPHPSQLPFKSPPDGNETWTSRSAPTAISIPLLREAIDSLDSKMATLMSQRHELESHLEQAVRLQSPVLRLPSDRYWSDVALNTPILWTKICVSPHDSLEKARRKLERSKSCPLDITVNFGPRMEYTTSITEHVIHAMDLIRPALWRMKSFRLSVPNRPQAYAALVRCREDAPLLETLSIRIFHSMQDDTYSPPPLPLFNGHTPRLQSCSLTSFNFGWDHTLVSRLRVLKLGGYFNSYTPSASTILGILRQCPDLEELALRNMSSADSDSCLRFEEFDASSPPKTIQLRRLTRMSFYYSGAALTRQIMTQAAFPNLESLELCYLENITPVIHLLYTQALTRLPLRFLRIETCIFNEMRFINLLRKLPSLITLELVDVEDASSTLLRGLSASQPWICPRLDTLAVDGCTSLDWDSLRTFVESRLPANPHAYTRFHPSPTSISSSASAAAAALARSKAQAQFKNGQVVTSQTPLRLRAIDITRCSQISKEMIQWLRMYVADVKCEPAKGVWGEAIMP
ncbi:hypothetical protein DXG03_004913 [Asterophora parasitica]|uniref:Uncharacterized protein n=1 Tax=Asterophora parasitica TaxID=117018 RepID=A0A9P7KDS0_9AGAR|nr:hypothetical protein DXG03_004913 [Asterophora parasitica]